MNSVRIPVYYKTIEAEDKCREITVGHIVNLYGLVRKKLLRIVYALQIFYESIEANDEKRISTLCCMRNLYGLHGRIETLYGLVGRIENLNGVLRKKLLPIVYLFQCTPKQSRLKIKNKKPFSTV